MKKPVVVLLFVLFAGMLYWWWVPPTVKGPLSDQEFEYIIRVSGNGGSSDVLPMIIALHGQGDTPDNFFDTLLKDFDYPARFIVVKGPIGFPGASLSGRGWPVDTKGLSECGDALADAVPVLLERFPTEGRPILLGFSAGAYIAYYLAAFHSDQFSYIFPVAGRLSGDLMTTEMLSDDNGARVIAFHGKRDRVVAFNKGTAAVQKLRQRGLNVKLVTFDGGHLDIFLSANHLLLNHLGDAVKGLGP
ncbi:MAG: hypothetical protein VST72_03375 [Nitrospirota bacterium]|nr:hypothetical protein [Nitrospirota bacterium]